MNRAPTEMERRCVLEAVAASLGEPPGSILATTALEKWLPVVRAVIRTLREPTDDMRDKIGRNPDCGRDDCFLASYQAGIDAASPPMPAGASEPSPAPAGGANAINFIIP